MRILVTGGAGFIGSYVVDALIDAGHEVRVLDSLHPGAHHGLPDYLNPSAEYMWDGVENPEAVERSVRGVDAVSHHAAMVGLGVDFSDTSAYVHHNDLGTAVLIETLARTEFRGRFLLASSMVVYGEGRYRCWRHGLALVGSRNEGALRWGRFDPECPTCGSPLTPEPIPESAPMDPRSVYAATKVHQEHLCSVFARETGASLVTLRYHNVYGPRMPRDTPYAGVASIFRSAQERGEPPLVFEDGCQLRDFVHVRDVARANVLALTGEPALGGPFNIASGRPRTVGEMANALSRAFGPKSQPPVVTGRYRLGDVRHVFASTDRARHELGFDATVSFEEGMKEFATAPPRAPGRGEPSDGLR